MRMQKACNLLHMPQPPNDSLLATCSDSHYILSECCIADWMIEAMPNIFCSNTSQIKS